MSEDSVPALPPSVPEGQPPEGRIPGPAGPVRLSLWQRMHPVVFASVSLLLVFVLYQVVAGGVTLVLAQIAAGENILALSEWKITSVNVGFIRWATVISQLFCILLPTFFLARKRYGSLGGVFPLRWPGVRQTVLAVAGVFALGQLLQVYMMLQKSIPLPPELQRFEGQIEETYRILVSAQSPWELLVVIFTVALVPALSEEFLFRGLVQHSVEESAGGFRAEIAAGIIFGAYHLNPITIVPLVVLGAYFGYLVYRSRNLLIAVSAHFFNNFVACVAAYMTVQDDFIVLAPTGPVTGTLLLANTLFFLVVFLGSTYYFLRVTDGHA